MSFHSSFVQFPSNFTLADPMTVYFKSSLARTRRVTQKQVERPAINTAEEVSIPDGKTRRIGYRKSARTASERVEHAAATYVISKAVVTKLEPKKDRTVDPTGDTHP